MMRTTITLILSAVLISCISCSNPGRTVTLTANLAEEKFSDSSVEGMRLHPNLLVRNNSDDTIYVYLTSNPAIHLDSASHEVHIRYCVDEPPKGFTYYQFPYPFIFSIPPMSSSNIYLEVSMWPIKEKVDRGVLTLTFNVGLLKQRQAFYGFVDHRLREQLVKNQVVLTSNEVAIHYSPQNIPKK